jgi:hypothetical protein
VAINRWMPNAKINITAINAQYIFSYKKNRAGRKAEKNKIAISKGLLFDLKSFINVKIID